MILEQAPPVIERPRRSAPLPSATPGTTAAWRVLGWFGTLLVVVGAVDLALAWYPLEAGSAWEFGMIARTMTVLPLSAVGLALLLASALSRGVVWLARTVGIALLCLATAVLALDLLFLLDVPIALGSAPADAPAELVLGVKKTIVKTMLLGAAFPLAFASAGIMGIRAGRQSGRVGPLER